MKKLIFAALAASMLPLHGVLADNVIYLGSEINRRVSPEFTGKVPSKLYVIFNRTESRLSGVLFFGAGSFKRYIVLPTEDVVATIIEGKGSQTVTAIARAETTNFDTATVVQAAVLKGVNEVTFIGGDTDDAEIPKTISGSGFFLDTGDDDIAARLEEIKTNARLQLTLTRESNDSNDGAGESITAAIQRVVELLQSKGYSAFQ